MMSPVDYNKSSSVWTQVDKWKGRMDVHWIFVKDIPNAQLRHLRVWNNDNKPVTNSRDTQELPHEVGVQCLRIFADFPPSKSFILSNIAAAEIKEDAPEERPSSFQAEEGGYNAVRQSLPVTMEEFERPGLRAEPMYPRSSWQSGEDYRSSGRQSYQFDVQDYSVRDSRTSQSSLNRRNTISSIGPIGPTNRLSNPAITVARNNLDAFLPPQSRFHDTSSTGGQSTYRSVLAGFAGLGEIYASNRYPPFASSSTSSSSTLHERNLGGNIQYDEDPRYF